MKNLIFNLNISIKDAFQIIHGPGNVGQMLVKSEKVDIICGPGNKWVTEAKRQLFGKVGIDGLYGPTESFIIGDDTAIPEFCAVDFVSQAEHDISSVPLFCTNSEKLLYKVKNQLKFHNYIYRHA